MDEKEKHNETNAVEAHCRNLLFLSDGKFSVGWGTPVESATAIILEFWRVLSLGNLILSPTVPVTSLNSFSKMFYCGVCPFFFIECSLLHFPSYPFYDLMIQTKTQLLAWYRWNKKRKCLYSVRLYSRWSIRSVQTATSLLNTLLQDPSMFGWDTRRKSWEKWKKKLKEIKEKKKENVINLVRDSWQQHCSIQRWPVLVHPQ